MTTPPAHGRGSQDGRGRNSFLSPSDIHILVVDDDRMSRAIVAGLLRKCSYTVTVVDSGVEAVEALKQASPGTYNLVLTDLVMPEVDGLDLLRYIRDNDTMKTVPVVMMSASESSENIFECIKDGAEDYLFKPLGRKEVEYIWQYVWRRRHTLGAPSIVPHMMESHDDASAAAPLSHVPTPLPPYLTAATARQHLQATAAVANSVSTTTPHTALIIPPTTTTTVAAVASVTAHSMHAAESLAAWMAARTTLDVQAAFIVFCRAIALLKAHHVQRTTLGRLRPSQLCFASNGSLQLMPAGKAVTPVCEQAWYTPPEEEQGHPPSTAGDVFSLGILFVDLFYTVGLPFSDRSQLMLRAREGCCPLEFLERREEADFVLSVLRHEPVDRPTIMDVLYSDTLPRLLDSLSVTWADRDAAYNGGGVGGVHHHVGLTAHLGGGLAAPSDDQALLDFLALARKRSLLDSMAAERELCRLDADIQLARGLLRQQRGEVGGGHNNVCGGGYGNGALGVVPTLTGRQTSLLLGGGEDGSGSGGGHANGEVVTTTLTTTDHTGPHQHNALHHSGGVSLPPAKRPKLIIATSQDSAARFAALHKALPAMERVYGEQRRSAMLESGDPSEHLSRFCENLTHYTKYASLQERATIDYGDGRVLQDMVCSVAFDRDDEFFATAGVSRRLKVFHLKSVLESSSSMHYPVMELETRSKLSCVVWNPYVKSHVAASDYDGTIQLWDASTKAELMQFEEHARRVWSLDVSQTDPMRMVSGSDDHAVKLWSLNCESSQLTLDAKANVCSVQFHPTDCNIIACGAANYRVYMYDLRHTTTPLAVLGNHGRSVSYVRFVNQHHLASASTDSTLRLWDIRGPLHDAQQGPGQGGPLTQQQPAMLYKGHTNEKNFVGLSISRGGYLATGSEDNSVVVYSWKMPMPLAKHSFAQQHNGAHGQAGGSARGGRGGGSGGGGGARDFAHFVSSVSWTGSGRYLTAANSMGRLKVLELV